MCAINGCTGNDSELMDRMVRATKHRGPDASRVWTTDDVSFGYNRLAIIDLDQRAMQPMQSHTQRYTLIFNGEIYNFKELKTELSQYPYRTESDTEVILAAFEAWGVSALERLNGMFALAIWDSHEKKLILARDPVGIKPLYYAVHGGTLVFSSEVRGVLESGIPRILNRDAFFHFMRLMYVPADMTMIEGVHKLLPGHTLTFHNGVLATGTFQSKSQSSAHPTYNEGVRQVRETVERAVERQLVSDRPIGIYLSGGIDSTVVLAAASAKHPKLNTYSVGFDLAESEESEKFNADSVLAKQTAAHFGATHHEYMLRASEVSDLFPRMIHAMDQPIGNATTLAQLYLAEKTKSTATVVLSGEGGDELFGGYERYRLALIAERYARFLPPGLEKLLPGSLKHLRLKGIDRYAQLMFQKDAEILPILSPFVPPDTRAVFAADFMGEADIGDQLMRADLAHWLVDEALLRADTMSMGASLEARVPLLDLEVLSLANSLPRVWKVDTSRTKKILKDAFADLIPYSVLHQPKRGWFSPGAKWLRRPEFVELANEVFSDGYTDASKLFSGPKLRGMWEQHKEKRAYHYTALWASLVFLAWAKEYKVTL